MARARFDPGVGLCRFDEAVEQMPELSGLQRLADDPGRCEVDLAAPAARGFHGEFCRCLDGFAALLAREGVSVACVDHQDARLAALEALPAPQHGRRARLRLRQHTCRRRTGIEHGDHQVIAVLEANSGLAGGEADSFDRWQVGKLFRGEGGDFGNIVGHGSHSFGRKTKKPRSGARLAVGRSMRHRTRALRAVRRQRRMCSQRFVIAPTSALS